MEHIRKATAHWNGNLKEGTGKIHTESGTFQAPYNFAKRFETESGTNPEELIAAAYASCFTMALAGQLGREGFTADHLETEGKVHLQKGATGFSVTRIDLFTTGSVPGIDEETFKQKADDASKNCPIAKILGGVEKTVEAKLK
jgi:lipoyl-dependent peroxiredoxin